MFINRMMKVFLIFSVALYISLVALTNVFDYQVNYDYLRAIMLMEHTLKSQVMWRAISASWVHHTALWMIILLEFIVSIILWVGGYKALKAVRASRTVFESSKTCATSGLLLLLLMFSLIFIAIGGQYFSSWQSQVYNSVRAVTPYFSYVGLVLLIWMFPESKDDTHGVKA